MKRLQEKRENVDKCRRKQDAEKEAAVVPSSFYPDSLASGELCLLPDCLTYTTK